jgi:AcrR family transcriptional regulator
LTKKAVTRTSRKGRQRPQSSVTRDRIVQVTAQAIHDYGVARITTKRIAEIAGVAEGTIFRHFETKNDLLLAALQRRGIPSLEMPGIEAAGFGTVRDNLAKAGHFVLRYYADVIPSIVAALADVGLLPDHRKWFQEHPFGSDRLAETVGAYVAREQRLGRVRTDVEPSFVAETLLGNCLRQVLRHVFYRDLARSASDEDFADKLADQITSAIATNRK